MASDGINAQKEAAQAHSSNSSKFVRDRHWVHHSCENRQLTCVALIWWMFAAAAAVKLRGLIFFISILLECWYGLSFRRGPHFGTLLRLCVHNETLCFYVVLWWANFRMEIEKKHTHEKIEPWEPHIYWCSDIYCIHVQCVFETHLHHCAFEAPDWYPPPSPSPPPNRTHTRIST